ncbi:MAG: 2-C-methyl-D-erythritol 4-phosphate cytidylyltransferase [Prolixibacteraceae bacterium]|nr:2-C-methyl-D-erythritol 4-phosphate cytidylyltransferase [Prolixibacteraceae bacterium]MBN2773331.1 2-C-methyl-D-erythritol 4-phosphate cytidylyltransferase [Prolixibacteraceae bacterium]
MKKFALIVAGGTGSRMGEEIPKQFLLLAGKPVLMRTIEVFVAFDPETEIYVVLPENQIKKWEELCQEYSFNLNHRISGGGDKRFYSVKNGLDSITGEGIVFIHDGVRPLVSKETLERCFNTAQKEGNAIPVVPITESLRKKGGEKSMAVNRSDFVLVQTPQTFVLSEIKRAYQQAYSRLFTDDASVFEAFGKNIYTVEGNRENIKITYPDDLLTATIFWDKLPG